MSAGFEAVDDAIRAEAETAFSFLERLIGARSTVGEEAAARRNSSPPSWPGSASSVREVPVPPETAAAGPGRGGAGLLRRAGPTCSGRLNPGGSPSLLLNGHVDVVPAEAAVWSGDPVPAGHAPVAG